MVLILFKLYRSVISSNLLKSWFSIRTTDVADILLDMVVKPTISANRTEAPSWLSAMWLGSCISWAAIDSGKTFIKRTSAVLFSTSISNIFFVRVRSFAKMARYTSPSGPSSMETTREIGIFLPSPLMASTSLCSNRGIPISTYCRISESSQAASSPTNSSCILLLQRCSRSISNFSVAASFTLLIRPSLSVTNSASHDDSMIRFVKASRRLSSSSYAFCLVISRINPQNNLSLSS
mmetsp:Transcript_3942/g.8917  ORF Transcript_3942/g.8917 Transcript_3942/m.8917 type:complete len:236 (+) Transcript_3942:2968-3675(+)